MRSIQAKAYSQYLISLCGFILILLSSTKWAPVTKLNPIIWLVSGILIIVPFYKNKFDLQNSLQQKSLVKSSWLLGLFLLVISGFIIFKEMVWVFEQFADKADGSDVIPSLEAYVQRFLNGDPVYVEIPFENYSVQPTYFPAMWMPYIIPEVLGFDYRFMAIGSFFLVYCFGSLYYLFKYPSLIHAIVIAILPVLFVKWYVHYDVSVFVFGTELMPLSFYVLFLLGLTQKKWWIIGLSIGLCTMSRYSYTLYVIPFIFVIWKECGFKNIFKIGVYGISVILILYVLPFLIKDPSIFTNGLEYYSRTATDQWKTQFWQSPGSIPYHLDNGLSFSYYFYTFLGGNEEEKLNVAKLFNLIFCLSTAIAISYFWFKNKVKMEWNIYLALSLLLYLVIFYSFLYVPFSYLFMLPVGFAMTIFAFYGSRILKYKH